MSDELVTNGGAISDVEITSNDHDSSEPTTQTLQKLTQKIQTLEEEKTQLVTDNESSLEKIKKLEEEIISHESDKRALSSIAGRAAELETELARIQHESADELSELKQVVEELRVIENESAKKIGVVEEEKKLVLERLDGVTKKLNEAEERIGEFEKREVEKAEGEKLFKGEVVEKDEKIASLGRMVEELKIGKNGLEAKVSELETKIGELKKELESNEKIDIVIDEKAVEETNGIVENEDKKVSGLKLDWPVIAVTAGAVGLVAVVYFRHAKF